MKEINKEDLKFVSMQDLIDEIENRTEMFIIAYQTLKEKEGEGLQIYSRWSEIKDYATIIGLCEIVKRDIQKMVESDD